MDFVRKFTSLSSREKNENILRNDKVMGMSLDCFVYYFLGDSVFAPVIVGPLCWVYNECYFMLLLCMTTCLNCAARMHILDQTIYAGARCMFVCHTVTRRYCVMLNIDLSSNLCDRPLNPSFQFSTRRTVKFLRVRHRQMGCQIEVRYLKCAMINQYLVCRHKFGINI